MENEIRYGGALLRVGPAGEYGFIGLPDGNVVFLHRNQVRGCPTLELDMQITYRVREGEHGLKAVDVEVIEQVGT